MRNHCLVVYCCMYRVINQWRYGRCIWQLLVDNPGNYNLPNLFFKALWFRLLFLNLCFFILSLLFLKTESMYMVLSSDTSSATLVTRGTCTSLWKVCDKGNWRVCILAMVWDIGKGLWENDLKRAEGATRLVERALELSICMLLKRPNLNMLLREMKLEASTENILWV